MKQTRLTSTAYQGKYIENLRTEKDRKKHFTHPIFIYSPKEYSGSSMKCLLQVVNIYEHSIEDFEFNAKNIIKHAKENYSNMDIGLYTMGQSIRFRVYEGQKPMALSLFQFFLNYTTLIIPILLKVDMKGWVPNFTAGHHWSNGYWIDVINRYIKMGRSNGNIRKICELIEMSKYLLNLWAVEVGDRIGLSISNNDFIEVAKRSKEAKESMTCSFPIPKNIRPDELEQLTMNKTKNLLNIISDQKDLPISVYAKNGLFNVKQFREFAVHMSHKPDLYGNTIPFTSNTNIMMGLNDPISYAVDSFGGRKAETTKLRVSDAGALERSLCMLLSSVNTVDVEYECDSQHFLKKQLSSLRDLYTMDGRVCTFDPKSDKYLIIDPDNVDLIGKLVYVKTPITCTHPRRNEGVVCSACYGKLLSNLNCDIHCGRLVALQSADDIEQKLLSAKHALATNTNRVEFNEMFDQFFETEACQIYFCDEFLELSDTNPKDVDKLFLEFNPTDMKKHKDGEGRDYDRSISEIVIYDAKTNNRHVIRDINGSRLFLSPEFVIDYFLPILKRTDPKSTIRVPFSDLVDHGKVMCEVLFEYQYTNNELAGPLLKLDSILNNNSIISKFQTYDELIEEISPLFVQGGIDISGFQTEIIVSQMIFTEHDTSVDWTEKDPSYVFRSIEKSIQNNRSPLVSILYQKASRQLAGEYGTFEKSGTSVYDYFIYDGTT